MTNSKLVRGLVTTVAIFALNSTAGASTGVDSNLVSNSVKVSYADLNLLNESGAQTLYRRLIRASKRACGVESYKNAGSIKVRVEMQNCYRQTLKASVEEIDSVELTKIYES